MTCVGVQWISGFRFCVGEWAGCTGERVDTGDSVLFRTLRGLNRHEWTQMDAQESVKSPRSMSSVHRSTKVAAEASSAVGAVASCSEGAEASSTEGAAMAVDELETDSGGDTRSTSLAKREC
jgi:hypothetical protein